MKMNRPGRAVREHMTTVKDRHVEKRTDSTEPEPEA